MSVALKAADWALFSLVKGHSAIGKAGYVSTRRASRAIETFTASLVHLLERRSIAVKSAQDSDLKHLFRAVRVFRNRGGFFEPAYRQAFMFSFQLRLLPILLRWCWNSLTFPVLRCGLALTEGSFALLTWIDESRVRMATNGLLRWSLLQAPNDEKDQLLRRCLIFVWATTSLYDLEDRLGTFQESYLRRMKQHGPSFSSSWAKRQIRGQILSKLKVPAFLTAAQALYDVLKRFFHQHQ